MRAQSLSRVMKAENLLARAKYRTATVYIQKNETELANAELDSVITICNRTNYQKILSYAKVEKGRLLQGTSNYQMAASNYFEALEIAEELGDKNTQARIKNYLASIYNYQMQYDLSVKYYKEALILVRELNFKPGISAVLTNLGDTYLSLKLYDSAVVYHRKALTIKKELGDKLGTGRVYNNLGNVFASSGTVSDLDSASHYYEKGLEVSKEINDKSLKALSLYGLVRVYFMEGRFAEAEQIGNELIGEVEVIQDLPLASRAYGYQSLVYAALGKPMKSIDFREMSNALADSLLKNERVKLTQELEAKYQNEAQQRTIELQEVTIAKRQNERNGLIVLAIIILIILGLIINQYRIKQKTNRQLRELDRIKSTFFENLSHEFRTPLSLIIAPLKDRMQKSINQEDHMLFHGVLKSAENLDELIKQLLDLAKLEENKYQLKLQATEASHFFRVIATSYESLAQMKEITFEMILPKDTHWLMFDRNLVRKVCNNLLGNAFKFTPDQGRICFEVAHDSILRIKVRDNGDGISQVDQKKIFDRFYQVEGPQASGTGIGLALTKELVEKAGGGISVESIRGEGTIFTVALPVASVDAQVSEGIAIEEMEPNAKIQDGFESAEEGLSLLIIEDNADLRSYLSGLFMQSFNIHTAQNGKEGIAIAFETIPDLVISDIMMKETTGLEVCKALKQDERSDHIPVILLTARSDQRTKIDGIQYGADAYITKPFDPEELKARANNLITLREKLRTKYAAEEGITEQVAAKHPFILKCEKIVQNHLSNESFSVDHFTKEVGMSRMQLHRKLKALTGLSTTGFVRHYRLFKAKELLESGEPVSQVAYAVGFSSLPYFTKTFKEKFGFVPSELAKK